MGIGGINKHNTLWRQITAPFADIAQKYAQQPQKPGFAAFGKTEDFIKDSLEVSPEAIQKARDAKDELTQMQNSYQELMRQLETAREQGEAASDAIQARMKCLLIAVRIMSGDDVPIADYRYLAKNDLELYAKAVSMRTERKNPKKHKRLSDDEKSGANEGENQCAQAAASEPLKIKSAKTQGPASADAVLDLET